MVDITDVSIYNALFGVETKHPLVGVVDFQKTKKKVQPSVSYRFGVYVIYLQEVKCGDIKYGKSLYDFHEGSLLFFAPNQLLQVDAAATSSDPKGLILLFHPALIKGTPLGKKMHAYSFFLYNIHEALHLSDSERQIVKNCFEQIKYEIQRPVDKHSRGLICSNIELLLDYCLRFYDRQFILRKDIHNDILGRFEALLDDYLNSGESQVTGFPQVNFFADKLNLSSNYFGDLIRKETGISPQKYIQDKVIDVAKERIFNPRKSIGEISRELGFSYPQHFTRFFKQQTGITPNAFRSKEKTLLSGKLPICPFLKRKRKQGNDVIVSP